jgi:hypothetical protein
MLPIRGVMRAVVHQLPLGAMLMQECAAHHTNKCDGQSETLRYLRPRDDGWRAAI